MFKVGDKIRAKVNRHAYATYKDSILIVDKPCNPFYRDHVCYKEPGGTHNGWSAEFFELVERKDKPKTEVDFLDCFKENFSDGG